MRPAQRTAIEDQVRALLAGWEDVVVVFGPLTSVSATLGGVRMTTAHADALAAARHLVAVAEEQGA